MDEESVLFSRERFWKMVDLAVPEFEAFAVRLRLPDGLSARLRSEDRGDRAEAAVELLELAHVTQPTIDANTRVGQLLRYARQEDRTLFDRIAARQRRKVRELQPVGREFP